MSLRDKLHGIQPKYAREEVAVPGIIEALGGEKLFVRQPSSRARGEYQESRVKIKLRPGSKHPDAELNLKNLKARAIVICLRDGADALVLKPEDAEWLGEWPDDWIEPLYEQAVRVGKLNPEDDAALKEQAEKNSANVLVTSSLTS